MNLAEGQVYESEYRVRYHVLALWDDFVWVHVMGYAIDHRRSPRTMERDFFDQEGITLLYDLRVRV